MNALHLCCGAGGITLGFERAGIETAWAFDRASVAIETHRLNFPDRQADVRDIRDVKGDELPDADVWTCGIPCEHYSEAGSMDDYDIVSAELNRLLLEASAAGSGPRYVFLENVHRYQKSVCCQMIRDALDEAGFYHREHIFRHADYGVPQRRRRWHLIASRTRPVPWPTPTHWEQADLLGTQPWRTF